MAIQSSIYAGEEERRRGAQWGRQLAEMRQSCGPIKREKDSG
jgi:hypothetical protein